MSAPVDEIEHEMARHQIRRLPDGRKRLVGMLTLGDLVEDHVRGAEDTLRSLSRPAEPDRAADVDCSRGACERTTRAVTTVCPWPLAGEPGQPTGGRAVPDPTT